MPVHSHSLPDLRVQLETQVDFLNQVSRHAVDTIRQLSELSLRTARQLLDDGMLLGHALAACKDPIQLGSVAMREAQPAAEHWRIWHGALLGVLTSSGATLAHDANDGGWTAARNAASARTGEDAGAAHNPT